MWNWNNYRSPDLVIDAELIQKFKKYAKISGVIFIILGIAGIFFPGFMSFTTLVFIAWLMLFSGVFSAWMTALSNRKDWAGWLKSFMLVLVSILMIFYPVQGIAALGILFAVYFLVDSFASFGLSFSVKPQKHWWIWLVNGIASLVLGIVFIVGWPFSSMFLVGLFVGVSLLFDGVALLSGSMMLDENRKEEE